VNGERLTPEVEREQTTEKKIEQLYITDLIWNPGSQEKVCSVQNLLAAASPQRSKSKIHFIMG
jgi:hypothetical protein